MTVSDRPLIGIVGVCGSGKSTLVAGLQKQGHACRHIAQEHSYVQAMWKLITAPDLLIYLSASFPVSTARNRLDWNEADYAEQLRRLEHARAHADLVIDTDSLTPAQVLQLALDLIKEQT
jgi:deoxyadenosine/deoxycytidine kinase